MKRKEILVNSTKVTEHLLISISAYILEKGKQFVKACAAEGLEGVMAKQLQSPYLPGKR